MTENNGNTSPSTPHTKSKRNSDLGADPKDLTDPPVLTPIPKQPRRSYSLYKKLEYIRYYEQECFGNKHRFERETGVSRQNLIAEHSNQ